VRGFDSLLKQAVARNSLGVAGRITDAELASCMEEFGRRLIESAITFPELGEGAKRELLSGLQPYVDELRRMFFRRRNGIP
jgi:hypothetical protein